MRLRRVRRPPLMHRVVLRQMATIMRQQDVWRRRNLRIVINYGRGVQNEPVFQVSLNWNPLTGGSFGTSADGSVYAVANRFSKLTEQIRNNPEEVER